MKNSLIIFVAKFVNFIMKLAKKNGGNIVGKIAKKMNPNIIKYFKINCPVIAVTATNGKTTTNNCLNYVIEENGKRVISNTEGNNMETGIISTFIKNSDLKGNIKADYITLEVDENYIPVIFKKIKLDTLMILDFFRDQLDRNGEVETLILKLNDFLKDYEGNLILNNDDPNVARLGRANPNNKNIYYYSVDKYEFATTSEKEAGEGKFCPFCNTRLQYQYYQYSHIGKFYCPKCGYGDEPIFMQINNLDVKNGTFEAQSLESGYEGKIGTITKYNTLSNNIYTIYNFAAVITCAKLYKFNCKEALKIFKLGNGRTEELIIKGTKTLINLAKNPTGANVSLRMLNEDNDDKELLFVLNDNIADGLDVSWIWDINFDINNCSRIITSGKRAYDIAIRIKTAGYDKENIFSIPDLRKAVNELYSNNKKKYVIANYTAIQPTRKEILRLK